MFSEENYSGWPQNNRFAYSCVTTLNMNQGITLIPNEMKLFQHTQHSMFPPYHVTLGVCFSLWSGRCRALSVIELSRLSLMNKNLPHRIWKPLACCNAFSFITLEQLGDWHKYSWVNSWPRPLAPFIDTSRQSFTWNGAGFDLKH